VHSLINGGVRSNLTNPLGFEAYTWRCEGRGRLASREIQLRQMEGKATHGKGRRRQRQHDDLWRRRRSSSDVVSLTAVAMEVFIVEVTAWRAALAAMGIGGNGDDGGRRWGCM